MTNNARKLIKDIHNSSSTGILLLFVFSFALSIFLGWLVSLLYTTFMTSDITNELLFIDAYRSSLRPEPQERFIFLSLVLVCPCLMFIAGMQLAKKISFSMQPFQFQTSFALLLLSILFLYYPFTTSDFLLDFKYLFKFEVKKGLLTGTSIFFIILCICIVWLGRLTDLTWHRKNFKNEWLKKVYIWILLILLIFVLTASWRIPGANAITTSEAWSVSADAVFYSLSQVLAGRTLLADLPSQYGLFAHLIEPIFHLPGSSGLSVFKFSLLCAILQTLSLAAIYSVVQACTQSTALRVACVLLLVCLTFGTLGRLANSDDPYFQYWPVRFFLPALSVLVFFRYAKIPSLWRAVQVSLVASVGTVWNTDTGLVLVVAFAGVLVAKWIVLSLYDHQKSVFERSSLVLALFTHAAVFCLVISLMFAYLQIRSGGTIRADWILGYQKIFYGAGYGMLPMPLYPHPWMSVLGVYVMAILVAAFIWHHNPRSSRADLLVYVALLGAGLFIYYQGRSHDLNLITVSWPAVVLLTLLSDRVLRAVKTGRLNRWHLVYPAFTFSLTGFICLPLILGLPKLAQDSLHRYTDRHLPQSYLIQDELAFLRQYAKPGDSCVILSLRQGLYYAETRTKSPLSGPGYIEMILQRDVEDIFSQFQKTRLNCLFIGLGESSLPGLGLSKGPDTVFPDYKIMAVNPYRSMLYLVPK